MLKKSFLIPCKITKIHLKLHFSFPCVFSCNLYRNKSPRLACPQQLHRFPDASESLERSLCRSSRHLLVRRYRIFIHWRDEPSLRKHRQSGRDMGVDVLALVLEVRAPGKSDVSLNPTERWTQNKPTHSRQSLRCSSTASYSSAGSE